jgi:hypothetical protein
MVIRLSTSSADTRGNKSDCNAKFAVAPHRHRSTTTNTKRLYNVSRDEHIKIEI